MFGFGGIGALGGYGIQQGVRSILVPVALIAGAVALTTLIAYMGMQFRQGMTAGANQVNLKHAVSVARAKDTKIRVQAENFQHALDAQGRVAEASAQARVAAERTKARRREERLRRESALREGDFVDTIEAKDDEIAVVRGALAKERVRASSAEAQLPRMVYGLPVCPVNCLLEPPS